MREVCDDLQVEAANFASISKLFAASSSDF